MFGFKKKNKTVEEQPVKKECKHKYKDFKWYISVSNYGPHQSYIQIYEPYVCVLCKDRIDKKLDGFIVKNSEKDQAIDLIKKRYGDNIGYTAQIEDEINDMTLVDRQFLEAYEQVNKDVSQQIKNIMYGKEEYPIIGKPVPYTCELKKSS